MRKTLLILMALLLGASPPVTGQATPERDDSLRTELVRSRGFIRAAETQLTKSLAVLDGTAAAEAEAGPPTVQDWRTGEWRLKIAGYYVFLDLDAGLASAEGVSAPIAAEFGADSMHIRLRVPGVEGLARLDLHHAEGVLMGTLTTPGESRIVGGRRAHRELVRTVAVSGCMLAQYTDDSWRIAPHIWDCQAALNDYLGERTRYAAAAYEPE